ncbi:MAG TPA: PspC domain-containing protein [Candidatus Kapabacteria bacterium]|nr:PspC domain-containing protein [Candidatus Kapabacteria bacterium]
MRTLTRPRAGRMIAGVATGLAELYRLPVALVRIFFIVTVLVSPIIVLLYLLLAIAMPDEENIASLLRFSISETESLPRERFERISKRLLERLVNTTSSHAIPTTLLAIALLFVAALLELPRAEGDSFYFLHPFLTSLYSDVSRFGVELYYLAIAALFVFGWQRHEPDIVFETVPRPRFSLDQSPAKMIGGVASGLSRVVSLDAAYIRVMFILLNILTLGVVGAGYLLVWYLERAKRRHEKEEAMTDSELSATVGLEGTTTRMNGSLRAAIIFLLIVLAAIHFATEFRLFFFDEPFMEGIGMALIGIGLVWHGLEHFRIRSTLWLLGGASVYFAGVYFLAAAVGNIQIASVERFEIVEIIAAISLAYAGLVALRNQAQRVMLWLALIVAISAGMIIFHITPPGYLAAIVRFYDFFYPIIFAGLGLWIAFER